MGKKARLKRERKLLAQISLDERLQAIYDHVPNIQCKGLCHESCGIIPMYEVEFTRLQQTVIYHIADEDRIIIPGGKVIVSTEDARCPLLDTNNRCRAYELRPFICRIWGVVKKLRCPHGCVPDWWLSDRDASELLAELKEINAKT